ncbi:MAG: dTDP-4-amino-4,6-dideoxygalactose transaminase [Chthoniobacterales bacterium]
MNPSVPFNRPTLAGSELSYVADAINRARISGDGDYTDRCQQFLCQSVGARAAYLTPSCTHALELAALLLNVGPGDEVIVPSFAFVSAANAFVLRGARPVFIDSRPDTLNLDEQQLEGLITPRTRAIVVVHYAGVACAMEEIIAIARRHGVPVVEDNAHGLFAKCRGRHLGTFGAFAAQSFHETKNFSCGEGGALLLNEMRYSDRAETIRQKGTDKGRMLRGQRDRYSWVDVGSSYSLSDLLAAFLLAQFEQREAIQNTRQRIWERYEVELRDWAVRQGIRLPIVPPDCEQPYHLFYLLLPTAEVRERLIEHLKQRSIVAVFHYLPLNTSAMGQRFGGKVGQCPIAEDVSERLLRLPLYVGLEGAPQSQVLRALRVFST